MSLSHHDLRQYPVPVAVIGFFDTVQVWLGKKPTNEEIKSLKAFCGHCHVQQGSPWWNRDLRCRLQLHQPRAEALRLLDNSLVETKTTFHINQVDLAIDMTVLDQDALDWLYEFLDQHLVKRWHGKQPVCYCETTRYTGQKKWQSQQIVMYPQRQSRINGQPCVHVEWRARGKNKVEKIGIYDLGQLLDFDHRAFWQQRLCLEDVDFAMLGRQFQRRGRAKLPVSCGPYKNSDQHVGFMIGRAAAQSENGPTAQDVRDWCRACSWFRTPTSLMRLNVEPFLPLYH